MHATNNTPVPQAEWNSSQVPANLAPSSGLISSTLEDATVLVISAAVVPYAVAVRRAPLPTTCAPGLGLAAVHAERLAARQASLEYIR